MRRVLKEITYNRLIYIQDTLKSLTLKKRTDIILKANPLM